MKNAEFFAKGLPKWPCLLVTGKKVTPEQATIILVRTDGWRFSGNDRKLENELRAIAGLTDETKNKYDLNAWREGWEYDAKVKESYGVLELEYLLNSRIVSCYIGGPHGWCDWQGNIFCNSFNIGKWPSIEEVYKEWKLIAKAFPFLDLRSQLLSGESCEDFTYPVVEFIVKQGRVRMVKPVEVLSTPEDHDVDKFINAFNSGSIRAREFGTTISKFTEALARTKKSLKGTPTLACK